MSERTEVVLADVLQKKGYIRGPFGSALKRPEMKSEGIPVYEQQQAIYNTRDFRFFIDEKKFEELKRFQVETNDLVISCSGTVGKVTIIRENDPKGIISQALLILRADSLKILPEYLKYFFASREGYNAIVSRSSGSVQVNISKREVIEQIPLSLPSLTEQEKIVGVLKTIDDKIENNNQINRNLSEQALSIYTSLFGYAEKDSTVGEVSLNVTDGVHNTVKDDPEGEFYLLSCKNIKRGSLSLGDSERKINRETFEKLRKRTKLEQGDILLSSVGTIGELLLLNFNPDRYEFQRSVAIIKPNRDIVSPEYLYCALLAQKQEIIHAAHGAVQQCIFISDIKGFTLHKPEQELLTQFNDAVCPMMETIYHNEEENKRLSSLRDSLLPKLMSGELDVSDLEV